VEDADKGEEECQKGGDGASSTDAKKDGTCDGTRERKEKMDED
jgi:hypothetical protein